LKNYIKDGNFEYIIDRQNLLNDGVLDPESFVKGEFQKVFKENAEELFRQNQNFFGNIKIAPDNYIDSWERLEDVATDKNLFNSLIGNKYIKVE
jgi:hypothetical protein